MMVVPKVVNMITLARLGSDLRTSSNIYFTFGDYGEDDEM
jgi:hypothetical protein